MFLALAVSSLFLRSPPPVRVRMSLIDVSKASDRGKRATAKHILLKGPTAAADAKKLKARIEAGELQFEYAAKDFSACGSARDGGNLGSFAPGKMVPAFDAYCFDPATQIGAIGVVDTEFGTHLVRVAKQNLGDPPRPIKQRKMLDTPDPETGLRS